MNLLFDMVGYVFGYRFNACVSNVFRACPVILAELNVETRCEERPSVCVSACVLYICLWAQTCVLEVRACSTIPDEIKECFRLDMKDVLMSIQVNVCTCEWVTEILFLCLSK